MEREYTSIPSQTRSQLLLKDHIGDHVFFFFMMITNEVLSNYHDLKLMVRSNLVKTHLWEVRIFWHPGDMNLVPSWTALYASILDLMTWLSGPELFLSTLLICLDLSILAQGRSDASDIEGWHSLGCGCLASILCHF